jgi:hypothetical protein
MIHANAMHDPKSEKEQLLEVMRIAAPVAVGLREATVKNGILQASDFVNGIIFSGILLGKNLAKNKERFEVAFDEVADDAMEVLKEGYFKNEVDALQVHSMGVVDQTPSEMLIHVGLSAEGVISEVAMEQDFTPRQTLQLTACVVALMIAANTNEEDFSAAVEMVRGSIAEKASVWEELIPSDEEMFGDFMEED